MMKINLFFIHKLNGDERFKFSFGKRLLYLIDIFKKRFAILLSKISFHIDTNLFNHLPEPLLFSIVFLGMFFFTITLMLRFLYALKK